MNQIEVERLLSNFHLTEDEVVSREALSEFAHSLSAIIIEFSNKQAINKNNILFILLFS